MEFSFRTLMLVVIALIAAIILIAMMSGWGAGTTNIFNSTIGWVKGMQAP